MQTHDSRSYTVNTRLVRVYGKSIWPQYTVASFTRGKYCVLSAGFLLTDTDIDVENCSQNRNALAQNLTGGLIAVLLSVVAEKPDFFGKKSATNGVSLR